MLQSLPVLLAEAFANPPPGFPIAYVFGILIGLFFAVVLMIVVFVYGSIWFQAYMSSANVSIWSLVGMTLRRVNARTIVLGKIMSMQAGIGSERDTA